MKRWLPFLVLGIASLWVCAWLSVIGCENYAAAAAVMAAVLINTPLFFGAFK